MSSSVFLCTCRGVYLASLVYSEDSKVLVTVDDQVPIVEVSDSHSSAIGADFVWLAKVSGEEKGEGGGRRREEGEVHFVDNFVSGPVQTCKSTYSHLVIRYN